MRFFWSRRTSSQADDYQAEVERLRAKAPVPALWLFGKTGSGKSSVVRYLTGAEEAIVGEGFRPETKTSRRFDFPDSTEPLLTFIDTRGLEEAGYDPTHDIERFAKSSQLMIVIVRVADHALEGVIGPLRKIRKQSPHRTVLLVLTHLHQATGTVDLSAGPDPFDGVAENSLSSAQVPEPLRKLLEEKAAQFAGLVDRTVAVDLTKPEDGFANPDFGGLRLKEVILQRLPHAYRQALLSLTAIDNAKSYRQRRSHWQVLASSALAASAGAIPIPWVDIPAVLAIQAHLAHKLAKIYGQELTAAQWAILSSAAGSRIVTRMVVRELLKFIPFAGMAAGAAGSFAFTYALGMSWDWYFTVMRGGNAPSPEKLKEVFADQHKRGRQLWLAE